MRASDFEPRAVKWLWWPYVPLGKITSVAGQQGQGKSLFTCWLAASVSASGATVMFSAEDEPEDTIVPRLEAAGANLERVHIERMSPLTETGDVGHVASLIDGIDDDVRLVTIDPVQVFLPGNVNSWKGQDVRRALEPLRQLAADRGLAVLLVQHLNRRLDAPDALTRIADSQGIPQLARSVLVWGPDPSDPDGDQGAMKVLTRAKGNLARSRASATFTTEERIVFDSIRQPALVRGDDREISADDVTADAQTRTAVEEAAAFLRHLLDDGPLDAKAVKMAAEEAGISRRTLDRAKQPARVKCEAVRGDGEIQGWQWRLLPKAGGDPTVGVLGDLGDLPSPNGSVGPNSHNANDAKIATPGAGS